MKSLFVLESGFQADTGALEMNNTLFDRQAYVGLRSNNFGQLTFGRSTHPSFWDWPISCLRPTRFSMSRSVW